MADINELATHTHGINYSWDSIIEGIRLSCPKLFTLLLPQCHYLISIHWRMIYHFSSDDIYSTISWVLPLIKWIDVQFQFLSEAKTILTIWRDATLTFLLVVKLWWGGIYISHLIKILDSGADVVAIRPGLYTFIIEGDPSYSTIPVAVPHVCGLDCHIWPNSVPDSGVDGMLSSFEVPPNISREDERKAKIVQYMASVVHMPTNKGIGNHRFNTS